MDFKIWGFMFLMMLSILFRVLSSDAMSTQKNDRVEDKGEEMAVARGLSTSGSSMANKRIPAVIRRGGGARGGGGGRGGGSRARGATILHGARRTGSGHRSNPSLFLASSVFLMFNFLF